jgi:hypothetical protein
MRVLCVIYSIPDPLTSGPSTSSTLPPSQQLLEEYEASVPPRPSRTQQPQAPSQVPVHQPPMQDIPEDVRSDDGIRDQDTATIRDERIYHDADKDWEVDSDWERRGLKRDRPRKQERQSEPTLDQQRQQYQQQQLQALDEAIANATTPRATQTTMPDAYVLPRSISQDQIPGPATHVAAPTSLAGLRSSVLPPPRPPPTAPLPNRPRMASGASIPPQLLNQPLPPIPMAQVCPLLLLTNP